MMHLHTSRSVATAYIAAALVSSGISADPSGTPQPIAGEQLAGTVLAVTPEVDYEIAVFRVSGPDDYALTRRFPVGTPISVDLIADRTEPRRALPDGRYRYEVSLIDGFGRARVHAGVFFVDGGLPVSQSVKRTELRDLRRGLVAGQIGSEANVDDSLNILDTNQNGFTSLYLQSFDNPPNDPDWLINNQYGDLVIAASGGPGGGTFVFRDGFQVGMGTLAPQQELHLDDPDGADIQLSGSGADWILGIISSSNQFVIQDATTVRNVFSIGQGAPLSSLVIDPTGRLGVGTATPSATLHVNGSGIIEGDVALGSSRTIKHEIEPLDPAGVLTAIRRLPIYAWKYLDDPQQAPHVGPMAEDVHAAFGVGRDEKHLSPADTAGLALAAIQGLAHQFFELQERNDALATENDILSRRLEAIERMLRESGMPLENE